METLTVKERELVAIGAAIASNCIPCMEYHIPAAREAGLTDNQIHLAIKIAEAIKTVPADFVRQASLGMLDIEDANDCSDPGCSCHDDEDDDPDACDDPGCACNQDTDEDSHCCS